MPVASVIKSDLLFIYSQSRKFKGVENGSDKKISERIKRNQQTIKNLRKDDISTIGNLINTFVEGRKVGRVPSSSADVITGDRIGDMNYDASYFYILIDNAGTPAWRRISLGSWQYGFFPRFS